MDYIIFATTRYICREPLWMSMSVDKTTIEWVTGTIALYGLIATVAIAQAIRTKEQRPWPTPGYEYVPENPMEKDQELS
jgi:hypothetical protein